MNQVLSAFQSAQLRSDEADFVVEPLARSKWFAGRNARGQAIFIIASIVEPHRTIQAGALTMEIGHQLAAETPSGIQNLTDCLILTLGRQDPNLEVYFAEICEALGAHLGQSMSQEQILSQLQILASLFGHKSPNRDEIKGFWGELRLLSWFPEPSKPLALWQSNSTGRMDFRGQFRSWEVKTCEGTVRQHHFSLNQLDNPEDCVVSIVLEESPKGASLQDLFTSVSQRLTGNELYKLRLRSANFSTSSSWRDVKFDVRSGDLVPKVFMAESIPRPYLKEAEFDSISSVRFTVTFFVDSGGTPILEPRSAAISPEALQLLLAD